MQECSKRGGVAALMNEAAAVTLLLSDSPSTSVT